MNKNQFEFKYKPSEAPPQSWEDVHRMAAYFDALARSISNSLAKAAPLSTEFEYYISMRDALFEEMDILQKYRLAMLKFAPDD